MKKVKVFAMALAALAMVSCNNDENGPAVNPSKDVKSLAIVIKNSPATRADGDVEPGKADENAVKLFGAFVREYKSDNAQAAKYVFRSTPYGTQEGESKKLIFGKVIATSTAYVIANYDPAITVGGKALVATTGSLGESEPAVQNGLYTQADVDMILQQLVKKDLNTFSKALQASSTDPKFSTGIAEADARYMLMTASQEVPTSPIDGDITSGSGAGNVLLTMALDREFVKIDAGQPELSTTLPGDKSFADVAAELGVAFDKATTAYVLRRVVPTVNYFGITELQGVFAKDNGADNDTQGGAATEFRFAYAAPAAGSATNLFYSSRNDSRVAPGATAIIYDVTYTNGENEITKETPGFEDLATAGADGGEATIAANATFHRFYRAYVAEDALNPVKAERIWSAEKNTSYKFVNSITGWGSADEETALTKDETVGLNVNLTIADWTIRELSVPMD